MDYWVETFNSHRVYMVWDSYFLCVHESILRWYGQGGDWIKIGLPMYISIDRKPESESEIQNVACGVSGIMIRLSVVKHEDEVVVYYGTLHGTKVMLYLVEPWSQSFRTVLADSYYTFVTEVEAL